MVGWLVLSKESGERRVRVERTQVRGFPLLCARVPAPEGVRAGTMERRLGRAARALSRAGCHRVLAPAGFGRWDALAPWGLGPVEGEGLCQALAGPLLLSELERRGIAPDRATVGLWSRRVNRACFQAAELLCPRVRRLMVCAGDGGEALSRYLREEFGVAALEAAPGRAADADACFGPVPGAPDRALQLWGAAPALGGMELSAQGTPPAGQADPLALAALLWEEGRISLEEVSVSFAARGVNSLDMRG